MFDAEIADSGRRPQRGGVVRRWLGLVQLLLGIGIVTLLICRLDNPKALLANWQNALGSPLWLLGGIACMAFSLCVTATRWHTLVHASDATLRMRDAIAMTFAGHLFNLALPGAAGGDIVRAAHAAQASDEKRAEAAATVLLDRLLGILSIVLLTNAVVLLQLELFLSSRLLTGVAAGFFLLLLGGVAATILLLGFNHLERFPRLRLWLEKHRIGKWISRGYIALHVATRNPRAMVLGVILSLICQLLQVACAWCMGKAIGIPLGWTAYVAIMPVVNTAAIIPIAPGGMGLREAVTQALFAPLGVASATAISMSLLVYAAMLVWAIAGVIPFAWLSLRRGNETRGVG